MQRMRLRQSIGKLVAILMVSGLSLYGLPAYPLQAVAAVTTSPLPSNDSPVADSKPDITPLLTRLAGYLQSQQFLLLANTERTLQTLETVSDAPSLSDDLSALELNSPQWLNHQVVAKLKQGDRELQSLREALQQAISQRIALQGQYQFLRENILESSRAIDRQIQRLPSAPEAGMADLRRQSAQLLILVGGVLQARDPVDMQTMARQRIVPLLTRMRVALEQVGDGANQSSAVLDALAGLSRRFDAADSSIIALAGEKLAAVRKVREVLAMVGDQIRNQFELLAHLITVPVPKSGARMETTAKGIPDDAGWVGIFAVTLAALILAAGVGGMVLLRRRDKTTPADGLQGKGFPVAPGYGGGRKSGSTDAAIDVDEECLHEFIVAAKQHVRALHGVYLRMDARLREGSGNQSREGVEIAQGRGTAWPPDNTEVLERARKLLQQSSQAAERGSRVLQESLAVMEEVSGSCDQVSEAINTVEAIAFEINLLSLNATVEAAHAGDHGNGFAVVAGEVRDLAQRSTESANTIKTLIETSIGKVQTSRDLITRSTNEVAAVVESATGAGMAIERVGAGERERGEVAELPLQRMEGLASEAPPDHWSEFEQAGKALDFHSNQLRGLIGNLERNLRQVVKGRAA